MTLLEWLGSLFRPRQAAPPTPTAPAIPHPPSTTPPPPTAAPPITPYNLVFAINRIRTLHGLDRLVEAPALSAQALAHSRAMASSGALNHDGFAGRIVATFPNTAAGENVEMNSFKSADDCAVQWMGDPPHKANMLGAWDIVGVGIVVDARGRNWITADFDRRG